MPREHQPLLIRYTLRALLQRSLQRLIMILSIYIRHQLLHIMILHLPMQVAKDAHRARVALQHEAELALLVPADVDAGGAVGGHYGDVVDVFVHVGVVEVVLLYVGGVLGAGEQVLPRILIIKYLNQKLSVHLQRLGHIRIQFLQRVPVLFNSTDRIIDLGATFIEFGYVWSFVTQIVPEFEMERSAFLDVLFALAEAAVVGYFLHDVEGPVGAVAVVVGVVFGHFLVPVYDELLIKRWPILRSLDQLSDRLLLVPEFVHKEERIDIFKLVQVGNFWIPALYMFFAWAINKLWLS